LIATRNVAIQAAEREREALITVNRRTTAIEEARQIVQQVAHTLQQRAHEKVASVVTCCLASIFDNPYKFKVRFDCKRGKTEAVMTFTRDNKKYDDPLNEIGGGVVDIAALALRLSCVMLSKPIKRRLLILDEPLRNVRGIGNRRRVRKMLVKLAEDLEFQFILNVDSDAYPEFSMGKIVELGR
jgi:hypothetical protein